MISRHSLHLALELVQQEIKRTKELTNEEAPQRIKDQLLRCWAPPSGSSRRS